MPLAITLHVLSAVIWVGGMFFAYVALRPAAALLDPPQRLPLWSQTFARFFVWVWAAIVLLPASGYWMIETAFGGLAHAGLSIDVMQATGIAMILIFLHIYFAPYRRLRRALLAHDDATAGRALAGIRRLIGINLVLGLVTVAVAAGGTYGLGGTVALH